MLQGRSLIILAVAILLGICAVIVANAYLGGAISNSMNKAKNCITTTTGTC